MNWKKESLRAVSIGGTAVLAMTVMLACNAQAGDYYSTVPFLPTVKIGPDAKGVTPVGDVFGKEYSHTNWFSVITSPTAPGDPNLINVDDHDAFAVADPLQVVSWDGRKDPLTGNSGSVDAFDYSAGLPNFPNGQVDALANRGDFLFRQVIRNEASLLFSVTADIGAGAVLPGGVIPVGSHVQWEAPAGPGAGLGAGFGPWAEIEAAPAGPGPGPGVNHHVVEDLDALEVWGPEPPSHDRLDGIPTPVVEGYIGGLGAGPNTADADRFSLDGDVLSGTSVWAYDIPTGVVSPWVPHSAIVLAVEKLFLEPLFGPGARFEEPALIDVDATMARDVDREFDMTSMAWGPGDELLFSIDPIDRITIIDASGATTDVTGIIDGGEIMHLVKTGIGPGAFGISFLKHGGHLWDTAFDVSGTFGYEFEDVDALEAVGTLTGGTDIETPEPSTLVLCGLAVALVGLRYRRRD